jgi:hypothetical protein
MSSLIFGIGINPIRRFVFAFIGGLKRNLKKPVKIGVKFDRAMFDSRRKFLGTKQ